MKQNIIAILFFSWLLFSCGDKKAKTDDLNAVTQTVVSHTPSDSLVVESEEIDINKTCGDESFDDFIYNFASDSSLQLQRITFPLPYNKDGEDLKIDKAEWVHDELFTIQNYYTLLFDREEDLELIGDTSLTAVQIEWIYLQTRMNKKYYFEKDNGFWSLDSLDYKPLEGKNNEGFIEFFVKFASDSIYQASCISRSLAFVTADPDDDFSVIETSLDLNQWFAFKPDLPTEKLSNINYGQRQLTNSNKKILAIKGIDNGFSNILYFRRKNNATSWELYKFEDVSI